MATSIKTYKKNQTNDEIVFTKNSTTWVQDQDILLNQANDTHTSQKVFLKQVEQGVFFLTIPKNQTISKIHVKKLCDQAQYIILPAKNNQEQFCKVSFTALKNHIFTLQCSQKQQNFIPTLNELCNFYFFYAPLLIEQDVKLNLDGHGLCLREILSNRTMIISNGIYNYPTNMTRLLTAAIVNHVSIKQAIQDEIASIKQKFLLIDMLISHLKKKFSQYDWCLHHGRIAYSAHGVTQDLDYASIIDDIAFSKHEEKIADFINQFHMNELNLHAYFPNVTLRSPLYQKARPEALAKDESGYVLIAGKEYNGKQQPIHKQKNNAKAFSLWQKRAERHLFRHTYKARVVLSKKNPETFALVGDQIATIALFPELIKGVFETLDIKSPRGVRIIAHNEDVVTIAPDIASWVDINEVSQKASNLFKLVSVDGTDPLSMFHQTTLPDLGVGNFELRVVNENFFSLLDSVNDQSRPMPSGHQHYLLGLAYECIDEWQLAALELKKALRYDTTDAETLHALGSALMETGQVQEALPFLKRAFSLLPDDPEVANALGRSNIEQGNLNEAIHAFEKAVVLSPGSFEYLNNLGWGYVLAHRHQEALDTVEKALRCNPHSAQAHAILAQAHLGSGDEKQAIKHAFLAYQEDPTDISIADFLWSLTLGKKER